MHEVLDLSITLTPPPIGSPPEALARITLECDALGLCHTDGLLIDPLTQRERDDLHWYLEEYWRWPYLEFAVRGKKVEVLLIEVGKRLFDAVLGDVEARVCLQEWQRQPDVHRQISIVSEIPRVLSLPWELLHNTRSFLVPHSSDPISIVRRLSLNEQSALPTPFEPPLRILLVTSRPQGAGFIDPRSIARELVDEMQSQVEAGTIDIEFLRPSTFDALNTRLKDRNRPIHVLHFDGHGDFDEILKQGLLLFETESGKPSPVKASDLAKVLQDGGIQLAMLTACKSAQSASDDAFSSVATQLIRGGVGAVVGMSASFLVASAIRYVEAFYRALAAGVPVPIIQEQARKALQDNPRRHLHRRHREREGTPVELYDWWLPHFYQLYPVVLQPTESRYTSKKLQKTSPSHRFNEEMPPAPPYGFSGRAHELLQIERSLLRRKLVVIHGFGGVGKTALARESADWLIQTGMYEGACFVSFEHGGNATSLLSVLGHYLDAYDGNYQPKDHSLALSQLVPVLKKKHTLVIIDNLESILPNGEAPLEKTECTELWNILFGLVNVGTGVLLTSRDKDFGDRRLESGSYVMHLPVEGLLPDDAYALATRLLEKRSIDRKHVPYAKMRDLLAQLDHHPLAIQLVLPTLNELPLSVIQTELATLLPRFIDDTALGHNRSLLTSLDYSFRRLRIEQRHLLTRLAIFEGRATEFALLMVTEISETEWAKLRLALEHAALMRVEYIDREDTIPYLHFHPVLGPFLRSETGVEDAALRERYIKVYYDMAKNLSSFAHYAKGQQVLAWLELPNLLHALKLLLEEGDLETASDMTISVASLLDHFGLRWKRNELWRQFTATIATAKGQESMGLTYVECMREYSIGKGEIDSGYVRAAYDRFTRLLERIEALPDDLPWGRGSYQYCEILVELARCLNDNGQPESAEVRLRQAHAAIDVLIKQRPHDEIVIHGRCDIFIMLGEVLIAQGKYSLAQEACEEVLQVAKQEGYERVEADALIQLGTLAVEQEEYTKAQEYYLIALKVYRVLADAGREVVVWDRLGEVARRQANWAEAERCYRKGLALNEQLGDTSHVAIFYNSLAFVTQHTGGASEAEGWYKRILELGQHVDFGDWMQATTLNNIAQLLLNEVEAGRMPTERLVEIRNYAERALAIKETLGVSSEIWSTLGILAEIAEMEGQIEVARDYRRRSRETFAAFGDNYHQIEHQWEHLNAIIEAAARSDMQAREEIVARLLQVGKQHIIMVLQRIWAGERNWDSLVEDLIGAEMLLVPQLLEALAQSTEAQATTQEQIITSLPDNIRSALEQADKTAFDQALQALSSKEQQTVAAALHHLQALDEEGFAQEIAEAIVTKDATQWNKIEATLANQEPQLQEVVLRIKAGERDATRLTMRLNEQDTALMQRVLEIIAKA